MRAEHGGLSPQCPELCLRPSEGGLAGRTPGTGTRPLVGRDGSPGVRRDPNTGLGPFPVRPSPTADPCVRGEGRPLADGRLSVNLAWRTLTGAQSWKRVTGF